MAERRCDLLNVYLTLEKSEVKGIKADPDLQMPALNAELFSNVDIQVLLNFAKELYNCSHAGSPKALLWLVLAGHR